jgi:cytochrome c oxidase cbb3-type subunit I/II
VPTFLIRNNVPTIATVTPYTPLEVLGRDIYVSEGCYNCHSQMVRPIRMETERYGEYSKPGEFVYDHPFQWGSRRIGPDLHRVGGKYPHLWHVRHMEEPTSTTAQSIMPPYPWLLKKAADFEAIPSRMRALRTVGVPYTDEQIASAVGDAKAQAKGIADEVASQGGYADLADKEVVALTAFLQRLGTDIKKAPPATASAQ